MAISRKTPQRLIAPYEKQYSPGVDYASPFDAKLNTTMPKLSEVETDSLANSAANDDPSKPVGMLSRIKSFVTDQASQFANEQMGTEEAGSGSGMGRVLRALAGAAVIGGVGGNPAMQLASGIKGAALKVSQQSAANRLLVDTQTKTEEDRLLSNRVKQGTLDTQAMDAQTRAGNVELSKVKALYDASQASKKDAQYQQDYALRVKGFDSLDAFRKENLKRMSQPKPGKIVADKPLDFPTPKTMTVDGAEVPKDIQNNLDIQYEFLPSFIAKIKSMNVSSDPNAPTYWESFQTPGDLRKAIKSIFEKGDPLGAKVPKNKQDAVMEMVVKERFPGAIEPGQNYDRLTAINPQSGSFETAGAGLMENIKSLAAPMLTPEMRRQNSMKRSWK